LIASKKRAMTNKRAQISEAEVLGLIGNRGAQQSIGAPEEKGVPGTMSGTSAG
jgi:hypothetical protein